MISFAQTNKKYIYIYICEHTSIAMFSHAFPIPHLKAPDWFNGSRGRGSRGQELIRSLMAGRIDPLEAGFLGRHDTCHKNL